jgi:hemerythrin HHE cation binding domain-containing protein
MTSTAAPSTAVRDRFVADHRELESLFARLIAAFGAGDREGIARLWAEFDGRVTRHLGAEERLLIPSLLPAHPREAAAFLAEHRHIRARLLDLGGRVDLGIMEFEMASGFIEELRAHARHEDDALYRWADDHLNASEQTAALVVLTRGPADRARVP